MSHRNPDAAGNSASAITCYVLETRAIIQKHTSPVCLALNSVSTYRRCWALQSGSSLRGCAHEGPARKPRCCSVWPPSASDLLFHHTDPETCGPICITPPSSPCLSWEASCSQARLALTCARARRTAKKCDARPSGVREGDAVDEHQGGGEGGDQLPPLDRLPPIPRR